MKEDPDANVDFLKRDFLKKAAVTAFTVPVMDTFTVGELHAKPHSNPGNGDGGGGGHDDHEHGPGGKN